MKRVKKFLFRSKQNINIEEYYVSLTALKKVARNSKIYAKYLKKVEEMGGIGYNILTSQVVMED